MKNINRLSQEEIKVILRATDEIIARGGRTLLANFYRVHERRKYYSWSWICALSMVILSQRS
jgi:hypothetical protein